MELGLSCFSSQIPLNCLILHLDLNQNFEMQQKNKNIYEKVEQYLNEQKNSFGDSIFVEPHRRLAKIHQEANHTKPQVIHTEKQQQDTVLFKEKTNESAWKNAVSIEELKEQISDCMNCPLGATRHNFVFGSGNPTADLVIIGEAPGADEDEQGLPFVGRAGQLLTKILESVNLKREDVFICNILKCRPPNNRVPLPAEIEECEPYLIRQLELINPEFILALGLTAVDTLLKKKHTMADIRGKLFDYHGRKMLVTYHPAALLRNVNLKRLVWEDMKLLRRMLDEFKGG